MALCQTQAAEDCSPTAAEITRTLRLPDSSMIEVREIRPADAPALQCFHSRLSETSLLRRFFQFVPKLDEQRATYFTCLDGIERHALVALDPQQPPEIIAVARYDREPGTDQAEYAIVVADRRQQQGLGLALTRLLIDDASAAGIGLFYAFVLTENSPMLKLFAELGLPHTMRREELTVWRVEIALSPARSLAPTAA